MTLNNHKTLLGLLAVLALAGCDDSKKKSTTTDTKADGTHVEKTVEKSEGESTTKTVETRDAGANSVQVKETETTVTKDEGKPAQTETKSSKKTEKKSDHKM